MDEEAASMDDDDDDDDDFIPPQGMDNCESDGTWTDSCKRSRDLVTS